jgi:hypothetical protein
MGRRSKEREHEQAKYMGAVDKVKRRKRPQYIISVPGEIPAWVTLYENLAADRDAYFHPMEASDKPPRPAVASSRRIPEQAAPVQEVGHHVRLA